MQFKLRLQLNKKKIVLERQKKLNKHNINTNNLIQIIVKKLKIHWEVDFFNINYKPNIKPIKWPIKKPKKTHLVFPFF